MSDAITPRSIRNVPYGPEFQAILSELHKPTAEFIYSGRNVRAGYTRGWGLEFGGLASAIQNDPIYKESIELARELTILPEHKLMNIYLIMAYGLSDIKGDFIEFGSYRGGSSIFIANIARRLGLQGKVYALDTYEGMPETDKKLDMHYAGNFSNADLDTFKARISKYDLTNLIPVKGLFEETTPTILKNVNHFALAHIDCDIYSAVKYSIDAVKSYMHPNGGYLLFDDPLQGSCLGALEAVEEAVQKESLRAEQAYPHLVYRYPKLTGL